MNSKYIKKIEEIGIDNIFNAIFDEKFQKHLCIDITSLKENRLTSFYVSLESKIAFIIQKNYNGNIPPYQNAIRYIINDKEDKRIEFKLNLKNILYDKPFMPINLLNDNTAIEMKRNFIYSLCNCIKNKKAYFWLYNGEMMWKTNIPCLEYLFITSDLKSIWK